MLRLPPRVDNFLLKRRERTLAARSEMLEHKEGGCFGGLEHESPKFKWMPRVYREVDYTQGP